MSTIYNQRLWKGSSSHLAAVVHVAGRNDRPPHPIREKMNQIQSELKHMMQKKHLTQFQTGSLEICLVETIRTVAPVATARATTRVQATTTTKAKGSIMAARIRLVDANVIIARRSLTRMAGHTEGAEGRLSFLQSKRKRRHRSDFFLISRADESGRTWCYTTGWGNSGCGDLQSSRR